MTVTAESVVAEFKALEASVDSTPKVEVLELDFESLTFGELCDIEDQIGGEASASLVSKTPTPKALTGAIWIIKRRADPTVTFEQVKALTIAQVDFA